MSRPLQQLELDLEYPPEPRLARARKGTLGFLGGLCGWGPVLLPFVLFVQIALLGLEPALEENERLAGESAALETHLGELDAAHTTLLQRARALEDPIFRERVRRARRSEAVPASFRPLALPLSTPPAPAQG